MIPRLRTEVVRIGKIEQHPHADHLSVTQVRGKPTVFRTGDYFPGDLAVHVPVGSIVNTHVPAFSWIDGYTIDGQQLRTTYLGHHCVKMMKIRGVPSYGFLVPLLKDIDNPDTWYLGTGVPTGQMVVEGECVANRLRVLDDGFLEFTPPSQVPIRSLFRRLLDGITKTLRRWYQALQKEDF